MTMTSEVSGPLFEVGEAQAALFHALSEPASWFSRSDTGRLIDLLTSADELLGAAGASLTLSDHADHGALDPEDLDGQDR